MDKVKFLHLIFIRTEGRKLNKHGSNRGPLVGGNPESPAQLTPLHSYQKPAKLRNSSDLASILANASLDPVKNLLK